MLGALLGGCSADDAPPPPMGNQPVGMPGPVEVGAPTSGAEQPGPVATGPGPENSSPSPSASGPQTAPSTTGGLVIDEDEPLVDAPVDTPVAPEDQLVEGTVCNSQEVSFEKVITTVMLVLDRSTSMFRPNLPNGGSPSPFGAYDDRWEALRAAVAQLEVYSSEVQFGAATYTGYSPQNGGTCPELQGLDIEIGTGNFDRIMALLPDSATAIPPAKSETPTAESMEEALAALAAVTTEGPKYMVLVTDGLPEMCAGGGELLDKGNWCGHDPAFAVVQNAFLSGVTTYVIGIIGSSNADEESAGDYFLNGIAHAGQGLELQPPTTSMHCIQQESRIARGAEPANDFYENWRPWAAATYGADGMTYAEKLYFAPSDTNLGSQLAQVVQATRSCSFEMDEAVVRARADLGAVQFEFSGDEKRLLTYQDANGWELDPDNDYTVVVKGEACTSIQTDLVTNVKIQFPCEVRVPRVR